MSSSLFWSKWKWGVLSEVFAFSKQVSGESVSVFKGFSLPQETEEYLVSHGLKGATYSISAAHVNAGSFGRLAVCPYQV